MNSKQRRFSTRLLLLIGHLLPATEPLIVRYFLWRAAHHARRFAVACDRLALTTEQTGASLRRLAEAMRP